MSLIRQPEVERSFSWCVEMFLLLTKSWENACFGVWWLVIMDMMASKCDEKNTQLTVAVVSAYNFEVWQKTNVKTLPHAMPDSCKKRVAGDFSENRRYIWTYLVKISQDTDALQNILVSQFNIDNFRKESTNISLQHIWKQFALVLIYSMSSTLAKCWKPHQ